MAAQELRWLTYLLTDLGEPPRSPPVLYVDNKAMLALCREQRLEHKTKHIALRYFLACELQQRVSGPLARRAVAIRAGRAVGSNDASPRAVKSDKSDVAAPRESAPRAAVGVDCGDVASASRASPRGRIVSAVAGALVAIHLAAAASPLEAVAAAFNAGTNSQSCWAQPSVVASVAAAEQSPYARAQEEQDEDVGLLDGRIRPCPLAVNPNCVSTSSLSLAYSPPWTVPSLSAFRAVQ
ncbi:unnamed protein product, partial [Closterium sp. NIES-54]